MPHLTTDLSWVDGNIEDAVQLLAETAVTAREKRAGEPGTPDMFNQAGDWLNQHVVQPTANHVVEPLANAAKEQLHLDDNSLANMKQHATWSLLGGGAGAALGAGASLFQEKKRRNPFMNALTGGLLGAGAGLSASIGANMLRHETPPPPPKTTDLNYDNPTDTLPRKVSILGEEYPTPVTMRNGENATLGAMSAAPAAGLDAAGLAARKFINRREGGNRFTTAAEISELLKQPNAKQLVGEDAYPYLQKLKSDGQLQSFIDGNSPPGQGPSINSGAIRAMVDSFRGTKPQLAGSPNPKVGTMGPAEYAQFRAALLAPKSPLRDLMPKEQQEAFMQMQPEYQARVIENALNNPEAGPVNIPGKVPITRNAVGRSVNEMYATKMMERPVRSGIGAALFGRLGGGGLPGMLGRIPRGLAYPAGPILTEGALRIANDDPQLDRMIKERFENLKRKQQGLPPVAPQGQ